MKDSDLKALILLEIAKHTEIDIANVGVSVKDLVVTLYGNQYSQDSINKIVEAVNCVGGVRAIAVRIELVSHEDTPNDQQVAQTIAKLFSLSSEIPERQIKCVVDSGEVTLSGLLENSHEIDLARNLVKPLKGVVKVVDNMTLTEDVSDSEIKNNCWKAFKLRDSAVTESVNISVARGVVYLEGYVGDAIEKDCLAETVWTVPGVQFVIDRLEVSAPK